MDDRDKIDPADDKDDVESGKDQGLPKPWEMHHYLTSINGNSLPRACTATSDGREGHMLPHICPEL
jgi:hypothetical protein